MVKRSARGIPGAHTFAIRQTTGSAAGPEVSAWGAVPPRVRREALALVSRVAGVAGGDARPVRGLGGGLWGVLHCMGFSVSACGGLAASGCFAGSTPSAGRQTSQRKPKAHTATFSKPLSRWSGAACQGPGAGLSVNV